MGVKIMKLLSQRPPIQRVRGRHGLYHVKYLRLYRFHCRLATNKEEGLSIFTCTNIAKSQRIHTITEGGQCGHRATDCDSHPVMCMAVN